MATFKSVADIKEIAKHLVDIMSHTDLLIYLLADVRCIKEGKKWNREKQEWEDNEEAKELCGCLESLRKRA